MSLSLRNDLAPPLRVWPWTRSITLRRVRCAAFFLATWPCLTLAQTVAGLYLSLPLANTENAGDLKAFWQGQTLGWDFGEDGAQTMMLVDSLPVNPGDP
jgi:hypothetical protein